MLNDVAAGDVSTGDVYSSCNLATCYQLVQSVLKVGVVLAKKGGIGGGGWV